MVSIRDVAEKAGVSLGTVSNVLNRPEIVAETTRQRVQAAIKELGFVRNAPAHQLRAGSSRYLGLVVLDVTNPFFTEVARGVEDAANEAGYIVILCNSDASLEKERSYLHMLEEQRIAGVLITPASNDLSYLQRLHQQDIAVVLLDRPDQTQSLCSVAVDDRQGGALATNHLLERGHRCIAFVSGPLSIRQCEERREGMYQAIKTAGLDPNQVIVEISVGTQNTRAGEQSVETLLHHERKPTAVFCANDLLALGVMRGLLQRGIQIPNEMALIGYDDIEFASALSPALSSIRQPKYLLGRTATELLLDEMANREKHQHQHIIYQPELIIRTSTFLMKNESAF
ncbi:LacI family transcriptional regulator [Ktedonobacter sp. SOSP1-85]|uniref:substrate-binding domain-containing protein n=1 Tax=Ktedonobacter sp. SOSP1-85 TaxID=2778367 RepID=UPI00191512D3|nr:substrate-binding domain-containing protein [Ktedonobacter sp. SOSP1-85]GHO80037.1 LacI family transcriptional regulator [Ktedonobacter sp. SOSP1-85]